jgi:hypothetical protein
VIPVALGRHLRVSQVLQSVGVVQVEDLAYRGRALSVIPVALGRHLRVSQVLQLPMQLPMQSVGVVGVSGTLPDTELVPVLAPHEQTPDLTGVSDPELMSPA